MSLFALATSALTLLLNRCLLDILVSGVIRLFFESFEWLERLAVKSENIDRQQRGSVSHRWCHHSLSQDGSGEDAAVTFDQIYW